MVEVTVSSHEAETMPYHVYKRTVWGRLRSWWIDYGARHPDDEQRVSWPERLAECEAQLALWAMPLVGE